MIRRWLAGQFARPSGLLGRLLVAPWLDRISAPLNVLVLAELDLQRDDRVLEVGFGGGGLLARILEATAGQVVGVDRSDAMVDRARRRFRHFARLRLFAASVESLPLPDGCIDKACAVETVYFWPDPEAGFDEIARVVRPGGRIAIGFEPPEELRRWPGHRFGFRLFEREELEAMMKGAGFGAIEYAEGRGPRPARFCCLTGEKMPPQAAP